MRVCTSPDPHGVAYVRMLYAGVIAAGVDVQRLSVKRLLTERWDIVHLHWPEWQLRERPYWRLVWRSALMLSGLAIARRRGARLVWTAHNVEPHEPTPPRFSRLYWRLLTGMVDGVISLHEGAIPALRAQRPRLADRPTVVIPQGLYLDAYPDHGSRDLARRHVGISPDATVLTCFGLIRRYKGVPDLVRAFTAVEEPDAVLLVAGRPVDPALQSEIEDAAAGDPRIRLLLHRIADEEVQHVMRASDVLVLPYLRSSNSAVALLALAFDVPIVAPTIGAFPELAEECGTDWVRLYTGPISPDVVRGAVHEATRRPPDPPDLAEWDWSRIAEATIEFYRSLRRPGPVGASSVGG